MDENEHIVETHSVTCSGYCSGYRDVKVYFDKTTGERIDYEVIGELRVYRDDTECDISEIPKKAEGF